VAQTSDVLGTGSKRISASRRPQQCRQSQFSSAYLRASGGCRNFCAIVRAGSWSGGRRAHRVVALLVGLADILAPTSQDVGAKLSW
jgi:hypothetical protein